MTKRIITLVLILSVGLLGACSSTTITTDQPAYGIPVDFTSHQFLWGMVGGQVHTSGTMSRTEVYKGFGDMILTVLTLGLYTPWSVEAWYKEV